MAYIPETFKIKMVEKIKQLTRAERNERLEYAYYNVFNLKSEDVYIDLITDSGTGAMSDHQWAGMLKGDESYAGARGYFNILNAVKDIFGYQFVQPVHQGRAAEHVLFSCLIKPGQIVISNSHFDTTRAHVELAGGKPIDLLTKDAKNTTAYAPFKGNIDIDALQKLIKEKGPENIAFIIITLTNNSAGGQPVSIENIKATKEIACKANIPLIIDAARFAENSFFIKEREAAYKNSSLKEIVRETFSYADAFTMSAKKDAIVNMGGLIGIRENEELYTKVVKNTIPYEGFITYGGLAGRDLEAIAIGLYEGIDYSFLKYRIGQIEYLGNRLRENEIPLQYPTGGHAVFVDAQALYSHIPYYEFPGQTLTVELYREGGIRTCDIGSYLLGTDPVNGKQLKAEFEFCRLAIPRRVYTQAHLDYVVEIMINIKKNAHKIKGYRITWQPEVLRHFTAKLAPVE